MIEPVAEHAAAAADNIKLVTALISASVAILVVAIKIAWDVISKRDERVFKAALNKQDISLEGQVKLFVDARLKGHDARLRIAAEWRIKMLDKMLDAGGDLRGRLNGVFAAINELTREATEHGPTPETRALVTKIDQAIRKTMTIGGFLPPPLVAEANAFLGRFDEIGHEIAAWSNKKTKSEREAAYDESEKKLRALATDMTKVFGDWHAAMWQRQEELLGALASSDEKKVEQLVSETMPLLGEKPNE